jgi:aminoglycoside phosphotransferase (APT) family kinase protein
MRPPGPRGLIHRDYHPENTLWSRGRLTGVVDWTGASHGPLAVDAGHMRWNLAISYGIDVADAFLRRTSAGSDQPYWDVVTALDVLPEIEPAAWARLDLERFERYVAGALTDATNPRTSAAGSE